MKPIYYYVFLSLFIATGCSSHTYDDIEPFEEIIPVEETVSYQDVSFVFQNICIACHSNPPQNGAPMSLTNYSEVKNAIETRGLIDRISRNEGAVGAMPLGGPRLPQQQIDLIVQWNTDGLLEN